jgi:maleylpyruvate isomerase
VSTGGGAPVEDLRHVADAQARFSSAIGTLTDRDVRGPSSLPGWSVGHVLTHVARNADSHLRRARAAERGEIIDQYPGGAAGRAAEIDAGAARPAAQIVDDVRGTAEVLQALWASLPDGAWEGITRDVGGRARPLRALPARRWQELEVHLVDLDIGVTHRDWPDDFVAAALPRVRADVTTRLPAGTALPAVALDPRDELAWLYGRLRRDDLPALPPWD